MKSLSKIPAGNKKISKQILKRMMGCISIDLRKAIVKTMIEVTPGVILATRTTV